MEFKYRVGKTYEYVYYLRKVLFTEQEKQEIIKNAEREYGKIWTLPFGESILQSGVTIKGCQKK
ncbi:hypothetical protein LF817_13400 [Halobacillus sp. A1]|uniref:hypothetical protein n=1 Tax=Halobacillus sp. A1 TaxID=2880262 RepID=UPI0020A6581B|nr:hypothetical protein [Halobacillus sp. A1]MCP3032338.1 hypothetical protein [Halobacillus sp. A1]